MGLVDLVLSRRLTDGWTIEHNNIVRAMTVLWSLHKTEICEYYQLSAFLVPDDQVYLRRIIVGCPGVGV